MSVMQSALLIAHTVSRNMSLTATHIIHISATNFTLTTRGLYRLPSIIIAPMQPPHNAKAWQEQRLPNVFFKTYCSSSCSSCCCCCWLWLWLLWLLLTPETEHPAGWEGQTWWENTTPKHYPPSLKLVLLTKRFIYPVTTVALIGRGGIWAPVIDCFINQRCDFNWAPLVEPKHSHSNACDTAGTNS